MDLDPERLARSHFFTGALGSIVALRYAPGETWRTRTFNVATGAITAGYAAPALIEWFHVQTPGLANAAAFFVGLLGMSFVAACIEGLKTLPIAQIIAGWLSRRG